MNDGRRTDSGVRRTRCACSPKRSNIPATTNNLATWTRAQGRRLLWPCRFGTTAGFTPCFTTPAGYRAHPSQTPLHNSYELALTRHVLHNPLKAHILKPHKPRVRVFLSHSSPFKSNESLYRVDDLVCCQAQRTRGGGCGFHTSVANQGGCRGSNVRFARRTRRPSVRGAHHAVGSR